MGAHIPVVVGTTAWLSQLDTVQALVARQKGKLVYASNFSIGVNLLFKVNRFLADLMNAYPQYDPSLEEHHHRHKADAPSGTARTLSDQLVASLDRKSLVADAADLLARAPKPEELSVGAIRAGEIVGTHRVAWHSEIDTLTIEHVAHSRRGFAVGAVVAAEWLAKTSTSGVFDFADVV